MNADEHHRGTDHDPSAAAQTEPMTLAAGETVRKAVAEPSVSVIIIFHNAATFLSEAVSSVQRQTFANWELLLVDDGSTDESSSIALAVCTEDPERCRYVEHPSHANLGMSASRNLGLAAARGRYVAFLDADDVYLPQRLEEHVRIIESVPDVDMVQSDHVWWSDWQSAKERTEEDHMRPCVWTQDHIVTPPEMLMTVLAAPFLSTATCSITVRRSTALAVGGFEESFRTLYEDQVFLTKIYLENSIYVLRSCLAKCRVHSSSCTSRLALTAHRWTGTWQRESRALIDWQLRYVAQRGIIHPVLGEQLKHRQRSVKWLRYHGVAIMVRARLYRLLRVVLAQQRYLSFMRWRRYRLEQRTWRQYRRLQALLQSLEAREVGTSSRDCGQVRF